MIKEGIKDGQTLTLDYRNENSRLERNGGGRRGDLEVM